MELKHTVETLISVEWDDLDTFCKDKLKVDYDFIQANECSNDSNHRFKVSDELSKYDVKEAEDFMKDGWKQGWLSGGVVLNALRLKGHIEPGTYMVNVCCLLVNYE